MNRQTETVRTGDDAGTCQVNTSRHLKLEALAEGRIGISEAMAQGMKADRDPDAVRQWLDLHDIFDACFNIVES